MASNVIPGTIPTTIPIDYYTIPQRGKCMYLIVCDSYVYRLQWVAYPTFIIRLYIQVIIQPSTKNNTKCG